MRKLLSLFVALIMVLSFATAVSAATEDKNAELSYDVYWDDEQSCYVLTAYLNLDGGLDVAKKSNRFTGSGLYSFMVTFNGVTADDFAFATDEYYGDPDGTFGAPNLGDGFLTFGGQCTGSASGLMAGESPVPLFYLYVNGDSEDDVKAKFSDLGYCAFKVATVSSVLGTYNIPGTAITTYAVGDDGVTKHVDADWSLVTPEASLGGSDDEEEEESNIVATSNREAVTEKATHQIGTAVGMTVTVPDGIAFQKMIWVIANGSERLYAKEIVDLSDLSVSGDIRVAATFVNGSHNDVYADAEVVAPLTIGVDDFDAIFTDGTNDYFTNAADKAE